VEAERESLGELRYHSAFVANDLVLKLRHVDMVPERVDKTDFLDYFLASGESMSTPRANGQSFDRTGLKEP